MNLDGVKVGDQLIISGRSIAIVSRVTKTLAIVERKNHAGKKVEVRYSKRDGHPPGAWSYGSSSARFPQHENEIAEIIESNRRRVMVMRLNDYDFDKLPTSEIETITGIINTKEIPNEN